MNHYKLLFLFTILSITAIKQSCAMDILASQEIGIVPINDGLLTEIDGVVAITDTSFLKGRRIENLRLMQNTLVKLMEYENKISSHSKGPGEVELFCPVVFKKNADSLQNLGQFNKKKHQELIEAIRANRALYYRYGQGALLYSVNAQPEPEICQYLNDAIEQAGKKEIILNARL